MVKVKICGITDLEGIVYVNDYLPDYIGFVFAESRRRVTPVTAGQLAAKLDGRIKKAGVFVNMPLQVVREAVDTCGLDVVQLHGDETPCYIEQMRASLSAELEIWKAIRVRDFETVEVAMKEYFADRFLLDTYVEGSYGGAGKSFDLDIATAAVGRGSIILAGGLNPENAGKAALQVNPFALDVSSGVETDGRKDGKKICAFIKAVRQI